MSRQYSNRPYIPSRSRLSLPMCDFVSYPPSQPNDSSSDSSSWQLTDPLSCLHQQQETASSTVPATQNDFSYFQYPPHRHTLEAPIIASNREPSNTQHLNQSHPPCHFHYLESNAVEPPRPLLPLSLVTVREKKILFFFISSSLIYSRLQQQPPLLLHIIDIIV